MTSYLRLLLPVRLPYFPASLQLHAVPVHVLRPMGLRRRVWRGPRYLRARTVPRTGRRLPHVRGPVWDGGGAHVDAGNQGAGDVSGAWVLRDTRRRIVNPTATRPKRCSCRLMFRIVLE